LSLHYFLVSHTDFAKKKKRQLADLLAHVLKIKLVISGYFEQKLKFIGLKSIMLKRYASLFCQNLYPKSENIWELRKACFTKEITKKYAR
jgi:hypothetical protein